jgi:hypothetical protein
VVDSASSASLDVTAYIDKLKRHTKYAYDVQLRQLCKPNVRLTMAVK